MGYFVAYRHTGADPEYLEELMPVVRDALQESDEVYCTYFDEAHFKSSGLTPRQIMDHAFQKIEELGGLFVLIDGPDKSDGQIMEVGYCIAKAIPFIVAKRNSVTNTYIDQMTDNSFGYDDIEGLKSGIKQYCGDK
jgi:nucleoside 2-deoxyribosyltransferase